jgi:hypothetical protein
MSGVRQVRVGSECGSRTASIDLDLDDVSIDPRAVSQIRTVCGDDKVAITIEADNVDGPVAEAMMPRWTRGPARAYRRPDVFDRARDYYTGLLQVDWLDVLGVTYLVVTLFGVFVEQPLLEYAGGLRRELAGSTDQ